MNSEERYFHEAEVITRYLLRGSPSEREKNLYASAMEKLGIVMNPKEIRTWEFMMRNDWAMGPVDAVLAIKEPEGNIRRKIFVMLAILEAGTERVELFLPRKYSAVDFVQVISTGARAVLRLVAGILLVRFL